MPSLAMYTITPPTDPAEFENICMDFLMSKYDADATLYGRRGQKQQGVDILVTLKTQEYIFAQCKDVKAVSTTNIDSWIKKGEECKIPMKEFILIVATDRDARIQEYVCFKNTERVADQKSPVKIFFWDDLTHFIKKDQTMLRIYYPELFTGQEIKLTEAAEKSEIKYPEMINGENKLRYLFFKEAVKYSVEFFLESDPIYGIPFDVISCADAFLISIKKLLYRAPLLSSDWLYEAIREFWLRFNEYCEFLPNVTECQNGKVLVRNKYGTDEEKNDINHAEELRKCALAKYNDLKDY